MLTIVVQVQELPQEEGQSVLQELLWKKLVTLIVLADEAGASLLVMSEYACDFVAFLAVGALDCQLCN